MSNKEIINLDELKGISIYFENDIYETALLILKLYDGEKKHLNETSIKRPTMHGLIRIFAGLVNTCYPDTQIVEKEIKKRKFSMNATIEF